MRARTGRLRKLMLSKADFADLAWKHVTLPHAWNEDDAFRKDIHDLSTGIAWYRKHFRLPATAAAQPREEFRSRAHP